MAETPNMNDHHPYMNSETRLFQKKIPVVALVLYLFYTGIAFCEQAATTIESKPDARTIKMTDADSEREENDLKSLFTIYQPHFGNFGFYRPIYFTVGTEPDKSKGQLSMMYRCFDPEGSWSKANPWLKGIHLAYTQITFWNLESDSNPFEDTSYMPELFYQSSKMKWFDCPGNDCFIQTGFEHESNGRSGDDSRCINIFYLKPILVWYHQQSRIGFSISPKIWAYLSSEDDDFKDFRGYFDLGISCGKAESLLMRSSIRWAAEGPSAQLDLTYPMREILFKNLNFYLEVQYTNSLAESLLNYRERTQALRIGLALVR
jgi:outer membrane phospholipase A